jgi:hypothetical protein
LWHILADGCTKSGVPLFGPFWTKDIRWSPLKTGTWAEAVLATALWGFVGWQGWAMLTGSAQYWLSHLTQTALAVIT